MSMTHVSEAEQKQERHYAFWVLVWSLVGTLAASILFLLLHFHIFAR